MPTINCYRRNGQQILFRNSFNKRCNDLERFLLERGYSSKFVVKEKILARKITRNELLDKENSHGNDSKLTFNVTYYPMFRHLKSQLKELHVILACDEDHQKVFHEVPIIGFKNIKDLKLHFVRAVLPYINEKDRFRIWKKEKFKRRKKTSLSIMQ